MSDDFFGAADARRDQFHADLDAREAAARARLGAGPGIDLSGNQIDTAPNGGGPGGTGNGLQNVVVFANGLLAVGPVSGGPFVAVFGGPL